MTKIIILQRVVPHYRVELFDMLYDRLKCTVVSSRRAPPGSYLQTVQKSRPWLEYWDFRFLSKSNEYLCIVPTASILRAYSPNLVISEFSLSMSSTYELLLRRKIGHSFKLAFWSHGANVQRGGSSIADIAAKRMRMAMLAMGDAALVYGEVGRSMLRSELPSLPVFVAKNTMVVPRCAANREWRTSVLGEERRPVLLSIGRLTALKRVPLLIEAFKLLLESEPSAQLVIVGDGPERSAIESAASELCRSSIHILGAVYEPDKLAALYEIADLFVYGGSIGLAVNESLAYGVPVVIFDESAGISHFPEAEAVVPGVTGWRVPEFTAEALYRTIADALSIVRMSSNTMKRSAMEYYEKELSIERMAKGFFDLVAFLSEGQTA